LFKFNHVSNGKNDVVWDLQEHSIPRTPQMTSMGTNYCNGVNKISQHFSENFR